MLLPDETIGVLEAAVVSVALALVASAFTYWLRTNNKTHELLFTRRKEVYGNFIESYGQVFYSENASAEDFTDEIKRTLSDHNRHMKMCRLMSSCRLVAGTKLEYKLRELYTLLRESEDVTNEKEKDACSDERTAVGIQVEALMRRDLRVIGPIELWKVMHKAEGLRTKAHKRVQEARQAATPPPQLPATPH